MKNNFTMDWTPNASGYFISSEYKGEYIDDININGIENHINDTVENYEKGKKKEISEDIYNIWKENIAATISELCEKSSSAEKKFLRELSNVLDSNKKDGIEDMDKTSDLYINYMILKNFFKKIENDTPVPYSELIIAINTIYDDYKNFKNALNTEAASLSREDKKSKNKDLEAAEQVVNDMNSFLNKFKNEVRRNQEGKREKGDKYTPRYSPESRQMLSIIQKSFSGLLKRIDKNDGDKKIPLQTNEITMELVARFLSGDTSGYIYGSRQAENTSAQDIYQHLSNLIGYLYAYRNYVKQSMTYDEKHYTNSEGREVLTRYAAECEDLLNSASTSTFFTLSTGSFQKKSNGSQVEYEYLNLSDGKLESFKSLILSEGFLESYIALDNKIIETLRNIAKNSEKLNDFFNELNDYLGDNSQKIPNGKRNIKDSNGQEIKEIDIIIKILNDILNSSTSSGPSLAEFQFRVKNSHFAEFISGLKSRELRGLSNVLNEKISNILQVAIAADGAAGGKADNNISYVFSNAVEIERKDESAKEKKKNDKKIEEASKLMQKFLVESKQTRFTREENDRRKGFVDSIEDMTEEELKKRTGKSAKGNSLLRSEVSVATKKLIQTRESINTLQKLYEEKNKLDKKAKKKIETAMSFADSRLKVIGELESKISAHIYNGEISVKSYANKNSEKSLGSLGKNTDMQLANIAAAIDGGNFDAEKMRGLIINSEPGFIFNASGKGIGALEEIASSLCAAFCLVMFDEQASSLDIGRELEQSEQIALQSIRNIVNNNFYFFYINGILYPVSYVLSSVLQSINGIQIKSSYDWSFNDSIAAIPFSLQWWKTVSNSKLSNKTKEKDWKKFYENNKNIPQLKMHFFGGQLYNTIINNILTDLNSQIANIQIP